MLALRPLNLPPVAKAALTSCTVMACSDVLCQYVQSRRGKAEPFVLDVGRTARFGLVGLTLHGPYFLFGFRALDSTFGPSTTLGNALKKTATGQVTMFPVYLVAFFAYMGALEGHSAEQCIDRVKASFPATYATGTVFWPIANIANFMLVPPARRVLYVNMCGLVWNTFLSWMYSSGALGQKQQQQQQEVTMVSEDAWKPAASKPASKLR